MFEGTYISTPFTEAWVAWVMLAMLIGLCSVNLFQSGMYLRAFASIFTTKERDSIFVGSGSDNRSKLVLLVYDVLLLAFTMHWLLANDTGWTFDVFLCLCGCAAAMLIVRFLLQQLVAFTFFQRGELDTFSRHYHYLFDCLMLLLYPVTLAALFWPSSIVLTIATCCLYLLVGLFFCLLMYKLIACFRLSLISLLYLPLYAITVEVLPIVVMVMAAKYLLM